MKFFRKISDIIYFVLYHFVPNRILLKKFEKMLMLKKMMFFPAFSGRVAISKIAEKIKSGDKNIALIPDYICNVVNMALEKSGYEILTYKTDQYFEPIYNNLVEILCSNDNINLLITANIYGSSAFLEELDSDYFKNIIINKNIHVIVDLCQDITLLNKLPENYGSNLSAVISFNDKSFPGVMGGGIITQVDIPESNNNLVFDKIFKLYYIFFRKQLINVLNNYPSAKRAIKYTLITYRENCREFDYSYCKNFPYLITDYNISKIQIILALIGFKNLSTIHDNKKNIIRNYKKDIVKTKHFSTSPYLVISSSNKLILKNKIKKPYAIHNRPYESIHGSMFIIHNKGFYDK